MFSFRDTKNVPIKGVDDKKQITGAFDVTFKGKFLPIQLTHSGKSSHFLSTQKFPASFSVNLTENHWINIEKSIEFFKEITFLTLKWSTKRKTCERATLFDNNGQI